MDTKESKQSERKQIITYASHASFHSLAMQPGSFINLFLTDYLLLPVPDVAAMLFVAKIIDFLASLVVGPVIEKSNMPGGKYVPWLKMARPLYYFSYIITFLPFNMPLAARYGAVIIGHLFVKVPNAFILTARHGALMHVGGGDMDKRNKMVIASGRVSAVCSVFTSATTTPFLLLVGHLVGMKYQYLVMSAVYGCFFFGVTNTLIYLHAPFEQERAQQNDMKKASLGAMLESMASNPQLIAFILANTFSLIASEGPLQITMYYYIYIRNDPNLLLYASAQTVSMVAHLATVAIGPQIGLKLGRLKALLLSELLCAFTGVAMVLFGASSIYTFMGIKTATSFFSSINSGFLSSYIIDCAEYGYYKTGVDNRDLVQSLTNIPVKISMFIGGTVALLGLGMIGYFPGMEANAFFTSNFMLIYGGMPVLGFGLSFLINLLFYKIDDEQAEFYARANRQKESEMA
ncbi:MAG: MFS transporter [Eubacteriaceae bacterium]|nr:MFS transporter [Eubacteriaceae bacterium]